MTVTKRNVPSSFILAEGGGINTVFVLQVRQVHLAIQAPPVRLEQPEQRDILERVEELEELAQQGALVAEGPVDLLASKVPLASKVK